MPPSARYGAGQRREFQEAVERPQIRRVGSRLRRKKRDWNPRGAVTAQRARFSVFGQPPAAVGQSSPAGFRLGAAQGQTRHFPGCFA